ncbi:uncharacterized protein LOC141765116 [Sebastes fasciatus]|uniref:uncharacterized protein LOC141765116 n=1 Tax=Sebastes fasciatus TaxID=394691 RepID=UPI003D9F0626
MNPHDWEAIQTLRRNLDPNHQNDVNNSMENASITNNEWDMRRNLDPNHYTDINNSMEKASRTNNEWDMRRNLDPNHQTDVNNRMENASRTDEWDMRRNLDPNHQTDVNNSMENASITNTEWDTFCKYLRHTVHEAKSSMGENVGWRGLSPPSRNFHIRRDSAVEDPDGDPLEIDEEDPELARKRKELREIEERIIFKRAAIALKTVEPFVKKTTAPDFPCNEQAASCEGATLKDRVNVILQQRHPASLLSKVRPPKEGMKSFSLLQDDHPLKLRVKALMKQRYSDPFVLPASREVPDVTPPPPSRNVTSPAKEEIGFNQGFQRFLSVLNKGVDMDFLSRIVTDDGVDLPLGEERLNIQPPAAENKSDPPFRREQSQQSNSGASLLGHSRTNSGDGKTDPPSQDRSLIERLSLPDDDEKKNDRGDHCFGSSSRSKSPLAVKKKKKKKKKEDVKPKVDEQHEQLQNILKTLGLSLEVEEMSKLADRTQERLYGKKHEDTGADSRGEQESRQSGSQRHYSNSSSSSSSSASSSSSRSTSRSFSRSPSRRRCSHSRDSRRRSVRSRSRDRSRDGPTCQDGNQDSKEAQRYRDEDGMDPKEISPYQHPYPPDQMYPHPHPAAFSAFPGYSLSQDSQYTAYHSGTHSAVMNSYWTHTQGAIPPSFYPSGCPYPQNIYHHFPGSVVAPNMVYPHHHSLDFNLLVNPDLSTSEGQIGSVSGPRCLQEISTKQPANDRCLQRLTTHKCLKRKGKLEKTQKNRRLRMRRKKKKAVPKQQKMAAKQSVNLVGKVEAPQLAEDNSEQSEEEKQPPTEEEIKANLRKTLEAFNQKVKQKVTQPDNSLT